MARFQGEGCVRGAVPALDPAGADGEVRGAWIVIDVTLRHPVYCRPTLGFGRAEFILWPRAVALSRCGRMGLMQWALYVWPLEMRWYRPNRRPR